jgi:hypothetical protein
MAHNIYVMTERALMAEDAYSPLPVNRKSLLTSKRFITDGKRASNILPDDYINFCNGMPLAAQLRVRHGMLTEISKLVWHTALTCSERRQEIMAYCHNMALFIYFYYQNAVWWPIDVLHDQPTLKSQITHEELGINKKKNGKWNANTELGATFYRLQVSSERQKTLRTARLTSIKCS